MQIDRARNLRREHLLEIAYGHVRQQPVAQYDRAVNRAVKRAEAPAPLADRPREPPPPPETPSGHFRQQPVAQYDRAVNRAVKRAEAPAPFADRTRELRRI